MTFRRPAARGQPQCGEGRGGADDGLDELPGVSVRTVDAVAQEERQVDAAKRDGDGDVLEGVVAGQMRPHSVVDELGQSLGHRVRSTQGEPSQIQADQSQPMPFADTGPRPAAAWSCAVGVNVESVTKASVRAAANEAARKVFGMGVPSFGSMGAELSAVRRSRCPVRDFVPSSAR